ncbi:hypothetical protein V502_00617 [Pseudogymnoascus sp. VKM F-4520 (FW-2644)]|nr:hypothetical protein V502_00617 [Pseudogymnoascus sp. VKM F-4520 (FW-2644)]
MQPPSASSSTGQRVPGAFNPMTTSSLPSLSSQTRQQIRRVESTDLEPVSPATGRPSYSADNPQDASPERPPTQPSYAFHDNSHQSPISQSNNLNYSYKRPDLVLQPPVPPFHSDSSLRQPHSPSTGEVRVHQRKHAHTQGFFEPSIPTISIPSPNPGGSSVIMDPAQSPQQPLSASHIAAQAAMQHQNHQRKRSQTLPVENVYGQRRPSRGPVSPPLLSLTEASGERQNGFGAPQTGQGVVHGGQVYRNGLLGGSVNAATTAANVVFARSPQTSPNLATVESMQQQQQQFREPDRPAKAEKSKVKLFSRPGKLSGLGKEKESKDKQMGSPSKLGFGAHQPQRVNMSTHSLADSNMSGASSMYSLGNSSSATIRPIDTASVAEKEPGKEKKHHHFLSRQKQKLSGKDDHHLPLSSANSNSRPVDPNAPSSFYNFNLPPSPGPTATSFSKSMSGLDLRHGGRALREKKREEKSAANHSFQESVLRESEASSDWVGASSLSSTAALLPYAGLPPSAYPASIYGGDLPDLARYGLNNMGPDDAWPLLKSKIFAVFQGEDLKLPIEDFNRLVSIHIQRCIVKRAPNLIIDDIRDLLATGFLSIDATLRATSDERLIPRLVEMWLFVFTSVLPNLQSVFLPLDLEFEGCGPLMGQTAAREFWGALPISSLSNGGSNPTPVPAHYLLSIRRLVLTTYRDVVILPRFEILQTLFSRLSLESINFPSQPSYSQSPILPSSLSTSPPDVRPGTAMSLDPAFSSYGSQSTTLLNGSGAGSDSVGARSRGVSNVSFGSDQREAVYAQSTRPFAPSPMLSGSSFGLSGSTIGATTSQREVNAEDSKHVTDTVGRMLQCMSVLAAVGIIAGDGSEVKVQREVTPTNTGTGGRARGYSTALVEDEVAQDKMDRLCKALKLNWLGRGRTGRNRRGLVGGRMKVAVPGVGA